MPRWLKMTALCVASIMALGFLSVLGIAMLSKDVQNPDKIRNIASSFMTIAEPLPRGMRFAIGTDILGTKFVLISDDLTNTIWIIFHLPGSENNLPPDMVIRQLETAASRAHAAGWSAGNFVNRSKGQQVVGGRTLFYETGDVVGNGENYGSLVGCFTPNQSGTTCMFGTRPHTGFDWHASDNLFSSIDAI
jgi:hypothetical protein